MIFLSFNQVPDDWDECETELVRLLYLIKNMENLTRESKPYLSGEYADLFTASATDSLTNEEAVAYSNSYYRELEHQSAVAYAATKAEAKGREEGREEGIAEGIAKEKYAFAKAMLADNEPVEKIMRYTGLTLEQLLSLK